MATMQFDYIETMVSMSPLDFNYEYGEVNNNSPDKFRINNCSIITKEFTQPFRSKFRLPSSNSMLISNDEELAGNSLFLDEDESYDVEYIPSEASVLAEGLWLEKEEKEDTSNLETSTSIEGILVTTFSFGMSTFQNLTSTNTSMTDSISGLLLSIINAGVSAFNLWATIRHGRETLAETRKIVNLRIEELNERIADNEAFIKQAQEKMNNRNIKSISVR